jgi:hypothetical protein
MKRNKLLVFFLMLLWPLEIFSQGSDAVEMADALRANGKIYVVVLGLVIILTGVIVFLIVVDRKIFKVEKRFEKAGLQTEDKR